MSTHDYSIGAVTEFQSAMKQLESMVDDFTLTTEEMEFAWEDGIIETFVSRMTVASINSIKEDLRNLFETAGATAVLTAGRVAQADETQALGFDDIIRSMASVENGFKTAAGALQRCTGRTFTDSAVFTDTGETILIDDLPECFNQYEELLLKAKNGELTEEERARVTEMLDYLYNLPIAHDISETDLEKMKMFLALYAAAHPEEAEKFEKMRYELDVQGSEDYITLANYIAIGAANSGCSDSGVAAVYLRAREYAGNMGLLSLLQSMIVQGNASPMRCITTQDLERDYGEDSDEAFTKGHANIYHASTTYNEDGSVDLKFTLSNQSKCYTEITVFDKNGNVVATQRMDYQKDGGSSLDVMIDTVKLTWDFQTLKAFNHDRNGFNSKQEYVVHIPAGGYCRVTEDPDLMINQAEMEVDRLDVKGNAQDAGEDIINHVIGDIDDAATDVAVHSSVKIATSGGYKMTEGEGYDLKETAKTAVKSTISGTMKRIADVTSWKDTLGNKHLGASAIVYKATEEMVKFNAKVFDPIASGHQQQKQAGSGAMYIYASEHPHDTRRWNQ